MIVIKLRVAWWFRWYLFGVLTMAQLTGLQPDPQRVGRWLARAVSIKVLR
ncbi:hypothetical protein [Allopusillimonas ginsengisoli]|nr:hypothetical protein [Allopusillimonas ginsengisoli]